MEKSKSKPLTHEPDIVTIANALVSFCRDGLITIAPTACDAHAAEIRRELHAAANWLARLTGEPREWIARDAIADVKHGLDSGALLADAVVVAWVRTVADESRRDEDVAAPCGWFDAPQQVELELVV